jgi:uncharacterized membrane protein HdeD (DUF308 family)
MAGPGEVAGGVVRKARGWAIAAGVLLIIGGIVALEAPYLAALVAALWVGWGLVFGGVAELISAFSGSENRIWKILLAVLYLAVGLYLLVHPRVGLVAISLTLAWLFLIQGTLSIFGALQLRPVRGWGWWLFDGIVTVLLGFLIFSRWPGDSAQIIAILVGISMILSGVNRLVLGFAL